MRLHAHAVIYGILATLTVRGFEFFGRFNSVDNYEKKVRKWMMPALPGVFLVLLFFYPVLFSDQTFFFRDFHRFFYPMKAFLAESFQNGRIPFWNPGIFCGSPFMSDMQTGVFYPPSLVFALFPFPASLNIFVLFHFFLAFFFFFLFLRVHGLHLAAALIGAVVFTYGGYTISSVNVLNNLTTVVWLPAVLWSHRAARRKETAHGFFAVVLFLAIFLLGGEPQVFAMGFGLLVLTAVTANSHPDNGPSFHRGLAAAALCLPALAVAAVQIGPTWIDYQHSARAGGLPFADAARFSLAPKGLWHFLLPLHFEPDFAASSTSLTEFFPGQGVPWLLTVYSGFLTVPLATAAVLCGPPRRRRWRWAWVAVFSAGALLALGRHTPVFLLFYKLLPVFRFPEKFVFLCSVALAVLAAEGVDTLRAALTRRGVRPAWFLAFLAAAVTADLYTHHRHLNPVWNASVYGRHHGFLEPVVKDSGLFRVYIDTPPEPTDPSNTILAHHRRWQAFRMPNLGMANGMDHVGGRAGLELFHQYWITELLSGPWTEKSAFLRLANVRYIVSTAPLDREPALQGRLLRINPRLFRLTSALPRAWLVGALRPPPTGGLEDLSRPDFDPSLAALSAKTESPSFSRPAYSAVDEIRYDRPNRIEIRATTPNPAVLVLAESAYPGWRVWVDGAERPVLGLDLLFQGVALEPGSHRVIFAYRPLHFSIFAAVSASALTLLAFFWILAVRRAKRSQKNKPKPE